MTRYIRKILFALIPLTFLLFQQSSSAALEGEACSPEPTNMIIDYGDLITCSINPTGDTDTFRFTGSAGDTVDVSVARRSGGDPCVELFNPQGGRLGGTCTSFVSRVRVMLTSTGVHTILVSELNGDATLDYTLSLERLAPPSPPAKPIFFGDLITDEIQAEIMIFINSLVRQEKLSTSLLAGKVEEVRAWSYSIRRAGD